MRKLAWWFCMFGMTLRRALYRPVFLLFLLIFPLGMGVLHQVEKRDSGRIAVALCPGTVYGITKVNESLLYKEFGKRAEYNVTGEAIT